MEAAPSRSGVLNISVPLLWAKCSRSCTTCLFLPQMENGCILSASYGGGCALPSLNGAAPPAVQIPGSETLPSLPDPPATGFYL